jgi:hypothetical protein
MNTPHKEERFADGLQEVADALRDQRPGLDPLALDAVKLRAMSRARGSTSSRQKGFFMRSRLTTVLTIAFLSLGTGGALAWVGGGEDLGLGGHDGGSASFNQYRECDHGDGRGKDHECHGHEGEHGHGGGGGDQGHGGGGDQGHGGGGGGGDQGHGGGGGGGDQGHGNGGGGGGDQGHSGGHDFGLGHW